MCAVRTGLSELCGTMAPGLVLHGFLCARSTHIFRRPCGFSEKGRERVKTRKIPMGGRGALPSSGPLQAKSGNGSKYSPHVLWIRLWIPYDFGERSRMRHVDLSICLLVGHPQQMEDTTTNCGSGRLGDDFHAFLDMGGSDATPLLGITIECNHS